MAGGAAVSIVLADTSVLINLAVVDRLDLLGALRGFRFLVPDEVVGEVLRPHPRELLERALGAGHIETTRLEEIGVIAHFGRLRRDLGLGRGEAACLALAHARGWMVASDEKRAFRREARALLGNGRLLNTPGLFILGIRHKYWTTADADRAKEVLERNRFRMRFGSFRELMRRKGS